MRTRHSGPFTVSIVSTSRTIFSQHESSLSSKSKKVQAIHECFENLFQHFEEPGFIGFAITTE